MRGLSGAVNIRSGAPCSAMMPRSMKTEKGDLRMDGPVDEVCKANSAQFA